MINSSKFSSATDCEVRLEALLLDRDRARSASDLRLLSEIDIEIASVESALAQHINIEIIAHFKAGGKKTDESLEALKRRHSELVYLSGNRLKHALRKGNPHKS